MADGMGEEHSLIICLILISLMPIPLVIPDFLADTAGGEDNR